MIHKPSAVACRPLGREPGDLKAISTGPVLRRRHRRQGWWRHAGRGHVGTVARDGHRGCPSEECASTDHRSALPLAGTAPAGYTTGRSVAERSAEEQPILRGDRRLESSASRPVAAAARAAWRAEVEGQGAVDPAFQRLGPHAPQIVTAGQHGHRAPASAARSSTRSVSAPQAWHETTTSPASSGKSSRGSGDRCTRITRGHAAAMAVRSARPTAADAGSTTTRRRRCVEQQQGEGEQAMAASYVHDAPATEAAPHPPGHLPRLVEFLARQAARLTDGAGQPIEQRLTGEAAQVVMRQPGLGRRRERHDADRSAGDGRWRRARSAPVQPGECSIKPAGGCHDHAR